MTFVEIGEPVRGQVESVLHRQQRYKFVTHEQNMISREGLILGPGVSCN